MRDNYELVYGRLLKELAEIDLAEAVTGLGGYLYGNRLYIKLLGTPYIIRDQGICNDDGKRPEVTIRIILCHYLLQAGQGEIAGEWVSYRDFKDSAFFMANFQINVEERIARYFSGTSGGLKKAAAELDGRPYKDHQSGDICYYFQALPKVPLVLVFYDKDEEFPASCKLLFDRSASLWLDAECLAALGGILADLLVQMAKRPTALPALFSRR